MSDAGELASGGRPMVVMMSVEQVASRNWPASLPPHLADLLGRLVARGLWSGRAWEVDYLRDTMTESLGLVICVGLGEAKSLTDIGLRAAGAAVARWLMARRVRSATVVLPSEAELTESQLSCAEVLRAAMEGVLYASHVLPTHARSPATADDLQVDFLGADAVRAWLEPIVRAKTAGIAIARDLAWMPPNLLTPRRMAEEAMTLADDPRVEAYLLEPVALGDRGFGAILAVAAGSRADALLVHLRYRPTGAANGDTPVVLVGKSVTFDAGGISLKPALEMDRMKADMAGGAAIIGALRAVLDLDLAVAIDIILPIVENMPGGGAMRPGDVITTYSGQTVEVLNTDAEGRLILADALAFAKTLNPRYVVDLATLTGASAIVFGPYGIGTFVNDASLRQALFAADRLAGERLWQLPLWPEYLDLMRSGVADLANISKTVQKGSMMTAASFLRTFIEPVPWAHLDIYNSAWSELDHPVFGKGPTGAGVATLVELLVAMSNAGT